MERIFVFTLLSALFIAASSAPAAAQTTPDPASTANPAPPPYAPAPAPAPQTAPPPAPESAAPAAPQSAAPAPAAPQVATPPAAPYATTPPGPAPGAAPYPPAPSQYPAPPPGYVYAPAPYYYPGAQAPASPELERTNARLRELELAKGEHRIGGPIVMMATGYGTAFIFGLASLVSFAAAEAIDDRNALDERDEWDEEDLDWNNDGVVNAKDERQARSAARISIGVASVGMALGIGGTLLLGKRLAKRRAYAPEIRDLKERRRQLMYGLRYGANVSPDQMQLSLSGTF